jgi:UDP-perosamine 4-acetyltransferase
MMEKVVIVGASGQAKVVIDILQEAGQLEIVGCTSGSPADVGRAILGIPVLGTDSVLPGLCAAGIRSVFVAVGDNRVRQRLIGEVLSAGFKLVNAISPRAVISRHVTLGSGVAVMPGAVINASSEINDGAIVNTGATVDHDCILGCCAHVAPGTSLAGWVSIGEGAFLGTGVKVIPRASIGSWSIIGAGAIVVGTLPSHVTAVGAPAAIIKSHEGEKL